MDRFANTIAVLMLVIMLIVMFASSWNDSATFDEVAHIPAGYTYLTLKDGRLNPEHPPFLKELAAFPLLFLHLNFDKNQFFWTEEDVNSRQWESGNYLLYRAGNNPDRILFWARLPMMILAIIFGWLLFWWVRGKYGNKVGLLTLFFFVTSPTILAHSRFVTTDVGASFGFFLGIIFFLRFLERRDKKSLVIAGLVFGIVQLFKFSLFLLAPIYVILGTLWVFLESGVETNLSPQPPPLKIRGGGKGVGLLPSFLKFLGQLILIGLIGLAVIYVAFIWQVWGYPIDQHIKDVHYILGNYKWPSLAKADFWMVEHNITRPLGQYFYGFLMVARRTAGGNTAYFEGELSSKGWLTYFPTLALLKEQLGFYILAVVALFWSVNKMKRGKFSKIALKRWLRDNFTLTSSIIFVIFYWFASIINPLNIGVRHVLPTFPFVYFLTARGVVRWLNGFTIEEPRTFWEWVKSIYATYLKPASKYLILGAVMLWMVLEIIITFPYYLSYYNIFGGGLINGYKIATDSNYDWGQDLKRLAIWKKDNRIEKIYLDYFGGGSPKYYLGDKFESWWSAKGAPPAGSYFAVSLNSITGNQAHPVGDIIIKPEDTYSWLKEKTPIARGGSSILIYKF